MLYIYTDETPNINLGFTKEDKDNRHKVLNPEEAYEFVNKAFIMTENIMLHKVDHIKSMEHCENYKPSTTCKALLCISQSVYGQDEEHVLDVSGLSVKYILYLSRLAKQQDIHIYLNKANITFPNDCEAYVSGELLTGKLIGFRINLESRNRYR